MTDHGSPDLQAGPGDLSNAEVREARERIVSSAVFRSAPQLASFLNYIVDTTLQGRQHEIKGYTIAVEALGRPDDFDPVADPIVRVEAGRLRRAIDSYYHGEGAQDPVRIAVERGSYVPKFIRVAATTAVPSAMEAPAAEIISGPAAPGVASLPPLEAAARSGGASPSPPASPARTLWMAGLAAAGLVAAGLAGYALRREPASQPANAPAGLAATQQPTTSAGRQQPAIEVVLISGPDQRTDAALQYYYDQVSDALSRFDDFSVLKAQARPAGAGSVQPTYRYEFAAQPDNAGQIVSSVRLLHVASGRVVWAGGREVAESTAQRLDQVKEIARVDAVRLAQPYGVLHADLRAHGTDSAPVQCIVRTYDYWSAPSSQRHAEVRGCLEATIKADPLYHPAWAMLAMIHLDEYRIGYNPRPGSALDRARKASQQAVTLAPESARALQGLMAVLTVSGEPDEALKVGFEAVRRNPFDTDILADLGARLTQAGRPREGRPLLLRAAEVNRARPVWHDFYLYLSARTVGDVDGARLALKSLELAEAPLALLAQAIGASDRGSKLDAMAAMRKLSLISPVFGDDAGEFLDRAFFAREVRAMLIEALVRGGLSELHNG